MSCRRKVYVYRTGCSGRRTTTGYSWSYSWGTPVRSRPVVVSKPKVTRVVQVVQQPNVAPAPVVVKKPAAPSASTTKASAPASAVTKKPAASSTKKTTATAPVVVKKPAAAAPSTKKASAPATGTPFAQAVLAEHNRLRAKHSAQPLKLNAAISRHAQEWANHLAQRDCLYHRPNNKYTENCHQFYGTSVSGAKVVQSWYSEIKYYTFGLPTPPDLYKVGHFTQVVWKGCTELGVGVAHNGRSLYVVCNYNPKGNTYTRFHLNVTRN